MYFASKLFILLWIPTIFLLQSQICSNSPDSTSANADDVSISAENNTTQWIAPSAQESGQRSTNSVFNDLNPAEREDKVDETTVAIPLPSSAISNVEPALESPPRNYASKECGAKVIFANDEAENKAAVLNDKERDDYMRNPCEKAQNKFLIIELCESIQPTTMEIANFELFSSSPKEIRFSVSERYPALEWTVLGEFVAQDNRDFQKFPTLSYGSYAKFVKLELLSHHGREHYCTLTCLRVYGISMVDEYEAEVEAGNAPPPVPSVIISAVDENRPATLFTDIRPDPLQFSQCTMSSAKLNSSLLFCHVFDSFRERRNGRTNSFFSVVEPGLSDSDHFNLYSNKTDVNNTDNEICSINEEEFINKSEPKPDDETVVNQMIESRTEDLTVAATTSAPPLHTTVHPPSQATTTNGNGNDDSSLTTQTPPANTIPIPASVPPIQQHQNGGVNSATAPPKVVPNNHKSNDNRVSSNPLPGTSSSHKESVFMKLNKRVTTLETNVSVANENIAELVRRYTTMTEENVRQHEKALKSSQEHSHRTSRSIQNIQNEILSMRQDAVHLRAAVTNLEEERDEWRKATGKLKFENRQLKQEVQNLQDMVVHLYREFDTLAKERNNGRDMNRGVNKIRRQTIAIRHDPIHLP
ncbi:SUN domain-containing protein 2 [Ditylenchus destructor]|nr:SUN domain-containing protein 2 [Ditylenchus destructor]